MRRANTSHNAPKRSLRERRWACCFATETVSPRWRTRCKRRACRLCAAAGTACRRCSPVRRCGRCGRQSSCRSIPATSTRSAFSKTALKRIFPTISSTRLPQRTKMCSKASKGGFRCPAVSWNRWNASGKPLRATKSCAHCPPSAPSSMIFIWTGAAGSTRKPTRCSRWPWVWRQWTIISRSLTKWKFF